MKDPQLARSLEVRERHSSGAFADRFVAVDRSSGKRVLLSVPRLDPALVDRVMRERALQAMARYEGLVHPHICTQLGAGFASSGHLWIAQELPEDGDPTTGAGGGALPTSRAAQALTHIAEALAYAHAQECPHGAVTVDAILSLESRSPRLADFGVGAALYEAGLLGELARESGVAAPEAIAGGEPSPQADVYALGAVGISVLSTSEERRPPSGDLVERARRVPGTGLAAALGRAVQPDPSARYRSAEEMLQQLRSVIAPPGALRSSRRRKPVAREEPPAPTGPEMTHGEAAAKMAEAVFRSGLNLVLALALLAAAVAGGLALAVRGTPRLASVPEVEGKPAGMAVNLAKQRGLKAQVVREIYDKEVPAGHVIQQTPYGGKTVREGRVLELIVSLGPPKVKVPKVTGKKLPEAKDLLTAAGLALGTVNREPASGEPDQVLQQSPPADTEVPVNSLVSLTVAVAGAPKAGSEANQEARAADVSIIVPEGPVIQRVKVEVHYPNGRYSVAYDRVHQPGDKVELHVVSAGEATVRIFIDGEPVAEQALSPPP